ncbi:Necrosis inducing protein NPP1 [Phytophthora megakarya]|uniref:Necrosis inducing protein NPP1 n=1 Tax=Phytophthora megakarya TaxID=4795 RepID=A0A225UYD6_9STRA|nr:Necrosis inducing protein NPP1 [Phytophthora megakarya]
MVLCCALLCCVDGGTINHDEVQPFAQPNPVTISEKAAVKYKPQLFIHVGCESFPAVNAAGEISGGLKGTNAIDGCEKAPLGSQTYGRSAWYQDKWAMVYAWYFPKNFGGEDARERHNWASIVLWIDNPALETSKILGVSLSQQTRSRRVKFIPIGPGPKDPYLKMTEMPPMAFVGTQRIDLSPHERWSRNYAYVGGSNVSTRFSHAFTEKYSWIDLTISWEDGTYHDLIMWEQLTNEAREALNSADFGEAKVPFNDNNFDETLKTAWPF